MHVVVYVWWCMCGGGMCGVLCMVVYVCMCGGVSAVVYMWWCVN